MTGTVKWFDDAKGFGFITSDDVGHIDVFAHYSQIIGKGRRTLEAGQAVEFRLEPSDRGPKAVAINPMSPNSLSKSIDQPNQKIK